MLVRPAAPRLNPIESLTSRSSPSWGLGERWWGMGPCLNGRKHVLKKERER